MDNFSNSEDEQIETTSDIRDRAEGISGRSRTKYISMVFDKKYIADDNNILGIANIGPQDILYVIKKQKNYSNKQETPISFNLEICFGNGCKETLSYEWINQRNEFFGKIKAELI